MDDITAVKKIMHFYYCLLVNIRIRRIYYSNIKRQDNSRSLKKWLKKAKEKKLLDQLVSNEVDWLMTEIDKYTPIQFELRIKKIYYLSKEIIESEGPEQQHEQKGVN